MSNFAFLPPEFRDIQAAATKAEGHLWGDQRAHPVSFGSFITDTPATGKMLEHIGEPSAPPPLATACGPPGWDNEETTQEDPTWGFPPVDLQPDYDQDQSVSW